MITKNGAMSTQLFLDKAEVSALAEESERIAADFLKPAMMRPLVGKKLGIS